MMEARASTTTGTIVGGFAHHQVLALADKVVAAVKSGAIKRFVVMAGCDGRQKARCYFTEVAENLPKDTVILTAGCAKFRYNKLALGDIGGISRVLDAGQCNDSYSLAVIALKLQDVFRLKDINELPVSYDIRLVRAKGGGGASGVPDPGHQGHAPWADPSGFPIAPSRQAAGRKIRPQTHRHCQRRHRCHDGRQVDDQPNPRSYDNAEMALRPVRLRV